MDSLDKATSKYIKKVAALTTIKGNEIEFSEGFTDLHTKSYKAILEGNGFNLIESLPSIELAHAIRSQKPIGAKGNYHPFVTKPLAQHPFSVEHKYASIDQ